MRAFLGRMRPFLTSGSVLCLLYQSQNELHHMLMIASRALQDRFLVDAWSFWQSLSTDCKSSLVKDLRCQAAPAHMQHDWMHMSKKLSKTNQRPINADTLEVIVVQLQSTAKGISAHDPCST